jgi:hypothetical protein
VVGTGAHSVPEIFVIIEQVNGVQMFPSTSVYVVATAALRRNVDRGTEDEEDAKGEEVDDTALDEVEDEDEETKGDEDEETKGDETKGDEEEETKGDEDGVLLDTEEERGLEVLLDTAEDDTNREEETKGDEDDGKLSVNNVNDQGVQEIPSPLLVGLMLSELTVMVSLIGLTAVTTARM